VTSGGSHMDNMSWKQELNTDDMNASFSSYLLMMMRFFYEFCFISFCVFCLSSSFFFLTFCATYSSFLIAFVSIL